MAQKQAYTATPTQFWKRSQKHTLHKGQLRYYMCWGNWISHEKNGTNPHLSRSTQINSKVDQRTEFKTWNFEAARRKYRWDTHSQTRDQTGKDFLNRNPIEDGAIKRLDRWIYKKLRKIPHSKGSICSSEESVYMSSNLHVKHGINTQGL